MGTPPHGWVVYEFTYDPRREIGSVPPFRKEWWVTLDFDPMVEIGRLRAVIFECDTCDFPAEDGSDG